MKNSVRGAAWRVLLALPVCVAAALAPARAETLRLQGSTTFNSTLLVPYQSDIESVSGHKLNVAASKSSLGLIALMEGHADLAMISAPLETEIDLLQKTRPDLPTERLKSFLIHHTRVAFAVNPSNPVRTARWATMRRVLNGELDNWKQLGGPDLPIRVVMVHEGGGVLLSIERQLMRGQRASPRSPVLVDSGPQLPAVVAQDAGAVGLAQLGEVRRHGLPEIALPVAIEQQLFLVSADEPSPAMYAVIDAARRVAAGQLE